MWNPSDEGKTKCVEFGERYGVDPPYQILTDFKGSVEWI